MNERIARALMFAGRPLSPFYDLAMRLRRYAYSRGILPSRRVDAFLIGVGNLSLGGTGKSPHVLEIARFVQAIGRRVAIVSRGYGGHAGKGPLVVQPSGDPLHDSRLFGDEPLMLARRLDGIPVIVGSDRYAGCILSQRNFHVDTVILDDGFQHLRVRKDLDLVLVPATQPFDNGWVFPGGMLREAPHALKDADAIIVTKANEVGSRELHEVKAMVARHVKDVPVFVSRYKASCIHFPFVGRKGLPGEIDSGIVAFCALADPDSFLNTLKQIGLSPSAFLRFRDHHFYGKDDLERIYRVFRRNSASCIITTEKDMTKIAKGMWERIAPSELLGYLHVDVHIEGAFWNYLSSRIESGKM